MPAEQYTARARDEVIPPGGYFAARLEAGDRLRITDVEGEQVPDVMAVDTSDPSDRLSMANTRLIAGRWNLTLGMGLYTTMGHHLFTVVEDTVGIHNLAGGYCNPGANRARFGDAAGDAPTCRASFAAAFAEFGLGEDTVQPDMCLGLFQSHLYHADGTRTYERTYSRSGDYVELKVERPCLLVVSNCPQQRGNVNGARLTPLHVRVAPG